MPRYRLKNLVFYLFFDQVATLLWVAIKQTLSGIQYIQWISQIMRLDNLVMETGRGVRARR